MQAKSQWQNLWMAMYGKEPFDITHYSPTSIKLKKIWNKRYYQHSSWQKIAFFHDDNSKNQWQLKGDTEISFWWNKLVLVEIAAKRVESRIKAIISNSVSCIMSANNDSSVQSLPD